MKLSSQTTILFWIVWNASKYNDVKTGAFKFDLPRNLRINIFAFHPLDGLKIKVMRGCKKGMLSKESGLCPVRIQRNCFIGSLSGLANMFCVGALRAPLNNAY
jgi:hypothetical protein